MSLFDVCIGVYLLFYLWVYPKYPGIYFWPGIPLLISRIYSWYPWIPILSLPCPGISFFSYSWVYAPDVSRNTCFFIFRNLLVQEFLFFLIHAVLTYFIRFLLYLFIYYLFYFYSIQFLFIYILFIFLFMFIFIKSSFLFLDLNKLNT